MPTLVALDFETYPITKDVAWSPPRPVGMALKQFWKEPSYMACGHPTENNATFDEVRQKLWALWSDPDVVFVMHNASFDLKVATHWFGFPDLPWDRVHDTSFQAYLYDPHSRSLALKDLAAALLAMPPDEQADLHGWLWDNREWLRSVVTALGLDVPVSKQKMGAFIGFAPANLVGRYAIGDVVRTEKLYLFYRNALHLEGLQAAYERERRLQPILIENERIGMRVDMPALALDVERYRAAYQRVTDALVYRLGFADLDSPAKLAAALVSQQILDPAHMARTPTGALSMARDDLPLSRFADQQVAMALAYRGRLGTALSMFMEPWLDQGSRRNGWISTNWSQTRGEGGGTRTGRPATSNPNFLNLSKDFETKGDGYVHPAFLDLPNLPLVRRYITADDEGSTFCHRDFASQELRIFAHYENGDLAKRYAEDPNADIHEWVRQRATSITGREMTRTQAKVLNFQALYGGGAPAAAKKLECSLEEAKGFKAAHDAALPGRKALADRLAQEVRAGRPVWTIGGRRFHVEKPAFDPESGRMRSFEYKLTNYVVQGSAADMTKQAIIDWYNDPERDRRSRFVVTVYDEINMSTPTELVREQMRVLKRNMESGHGCSVRMLSDAKTGPNWGALRKYADD